MLPYVDCAKNKKIAFLSSIVNLRETIRQRCKFWAIFQIVRVCCELESGWRAIVILYDVAFFGVKGK